MAEYVIGIGSNLGDRKEYLRQSTDLLSDHAIGKIQKSSIYETEALGGISKGSFLNAVIRCEINQDPLELLENLKKIEIFLGRDVKAKRWSDRIIDLDIIASRNLILENEQITVPHKEYQNRLFVLLPMAEIYPEWVDPRSGKPIQKIIDESEQFYVSKTSLIW